VGLFYFKSVMVTIGAVVPAGDLLPFAERLKKIIEVLRTR
jgi:hypothetical protein